jgi:segregation and condensation protein A
MADGSVTSGSARDYDGNRTARQTTEGSPVNAPAPPPSDTDPPPSDYRVELDAYAGPLDLLLYLVKRHEIDLHDIPIAELTEQYLDHLRIIRQINVDQAGEFLVMAATLLEIKSRMIQPEPLPGEDDEGETSGGEDPAHDALDAIDPRHELVQQLLEYKRIKDAAIGLEQKRERWAARFNVGVKAGKPEKPEEPDNAAPVEIDLEDVHVLDLCEAFSRILETIGHVGDHEVTYDDTPISLHAEDIHDRLRRDGNMTLQQIFVGRTRKAEMIGLFLALLELTRQRIVRVTQDQAAGQINIELRPEEEHAVDGITPDEPETDWTNPETGEVEYDWPSEEARRRYERRQARRRKFGEQRDEEEDDPVLVDEDEAEDAEEDDDAFEDDAPDQDTER